MNKFENFRKILEKIKNLKNDLDVLRHDTIIKTTNACEHPIEFVRELKPKSSWYGSGRPSVICTQCGYCEEGWGCGYIKFRGKEFGLLEISSEEFNKLRTRCVFQKREDDKERIDRTY